MKKEINQTVQFYFDPVSPFSWLASRELPRLQAADLRIDCQPVLFAGLLNAHGQKGPAEIPAKRVYTFHDVVRIAQQRGYPFQGPPTHPYNPLRALRMCVALTDADERLRMACALLRACWEQGRDLSDLTALLQIAAESGLEARQLGAAIEIPAVKAALKSATEDAIKLGIFGVPTFVLNGELFWGADRIDALLWRLEHPANDLKALDHFLQRGASASRKQT